MASGFGLSWYSSSTGWYTSNHISKKRGFAQGSNRIGSVRRLLCGFFRFAKKLCKAVMFGIQSKRMDSKMGQTRQHDSTSRLPKHTKQSCWRTVPQRLSQLLMVRNYQRHVFIMIAESSKIPKLLLWNSSGFGAVVRKKLEKQKYLMKNTSGSGSTWTLDLVEKSSFWNSLTWTFCFPDSTMTWMSLRGVRPLLRSWFFHEKMWNPKSYGASHGNLRRLSKAEFLWTLPGLVLWTRRQSTVHAKWSQNHLDDVHENQLAMSTSMVREVFSGHL